MNATRRTLVLALGTALLAGCAVTRSMQFEAAAAPAAASGEDAGIAGARLSFEAESGFLADDEPAANPSAPHSADQPSATSPAERKLIYTGWMRLAVADRVAAGKAASELTESLGGYVHELSDESVTLRIPVERWDEALGKAAQIGRVVHRRIQVQDVTEEFLDVELQLKNLRALSDRLTELLAKAENVEAALKVEKELARVRSDIERLQGRLEYLQNHVAFATLTLEFVQISDAPPSGRLPFPWLTRLGVERLLGLPGATR